MTNKHADLINRLRNPCPVSDWMPLLQEAADALKSESAAVPEGWKLVPIEPTKEMKRALFINLVHADDETYVIRAIIAAAPQPPSPASEAVPPITEQESFWLTMREELHPLTVNLVVRFSRALAKKLAAAEKKYGYSNGWASADWMDECRTKLLEHVAKGDPCDVAAYCAFLWHHGEKTSIKPVSAKQYLDRNADMEAAIAILINTATFGSEPLYADGSDTPNRMLQLKAAKFLHGLISSETFEEKYKWLLGQKISMPPVSANSLPLTDEQERMTFEDWALRTICERSDMQRKQLTGYGSQELNYLWRGWKARAIETAHGITQEATK